MVSSLPMHPVRCAVLVIFNVNLCVCTLVFVHMCTFTSSEIMYFLSLTLMLAPLVKVTLKPQEYRPTFIYCISYMLLSQMEQRN